MNKSESIEVVNKRYTHPRNIIAAFTEKLAHQTDFQGIGAAFGQDIISIGAEDDPSGTDGEVTEFAVPPEVVQIELGDTIDSFNPGDTIEETLSGSSGVYFTTYDFDFLRGVWFDGVLALYNEHWTLSGTNAIIPNVTLADDTIVIGRYVIGEL